jgi:hypothetical protein
MHAFALGAEIDPPTSLCHSAFIVIRASDCTPHQQCTLRRAYHRTRERI